jgi:hypothetical protein
MKMKMKYIWVMVASVLFLFVSCLKDGLEEVELTTECEVTNIEFEHRWIINPGDVEGMAKLYFQKLTVIKTIDIDDATITVQLTVPNVSANFPVEQREATVISNLACSFFVSNAASVTPLNGAPELGTLGDYSKATAISPLVYRVIAAAGNYKDWKIIITDFIK